NQARDLCGNCRSESSGERGDFRSLGSGECYRTRAEEIGIGSANCFARSIHATILVAVAAWGASGPIFKTRRSNPTPAKKRSLEYLSQQLAARPRSRNSLSSL